jgi:hypothetical protein
MGQRRPRWLADATRSLCKSLIMRIVNVNEPYCFLSSVGLKKAKDVRRICSRWSKAELTRFLVDYANMSLKRELPEQATNGSLSVLPDSQSDLYALSTIKQLALYLDRVFLHDPIPAILRDFQEVKLIPNQSSHSGRETVLRSNLVHSLEHLLKLKPLAKIGVITIQPTSLSDLAQPPGAVFSDDLFYGDGRPGRDPMEGLDCKANLEKYLENVQIFPLDPLSHRPIPVMSTEPITSRAIQLQIRGDVSSRIRMFFEILPKPVDQDGYQFQCRLDKQKSLDWSKFSNWANAEAKKLVVQRLNQVKRDVSLARFVGATLLTNIAVTRDLMPFAVGAQVDEVKPLSSLMELQLPFFEHASISSLAKARTNEIAYSEFRSQMTKVLHELSAIQSVTDRKRRSNELLHDLIELPLNKVNHANKRLRESLFINCGISIGSLAGLLLSSPNVPINGALLAGLCVLAEVKGLEGLKDYRASYNAIKDTPGFFYWQAIQR